MKKPHLSESEFWTALREHAGIYARTAKAITEKYNIPYTRQGVKARAERYPERLQDIIDQNLDVAESELINLMQSKNQRVKLHAVEFYLRTKGRNRDYVERNEASVLIKTPDNILNKDEILAEIARIEKILETKS